MYSTFFIRYIKNLQNDKISKINNEKVQKSLKLQKWSSKWTTDPNIVNFKIFYEYFYFVQIIDTVLSEEMYFYRY